MPDVSCCPLCSGSALLPVASRSRISREIQTRNEFVHTRLARKPALGELKDLTDFMHGFPAPLVSCARCGVLLRKEQNVREAHTYEEDLNDSSWMRHVLPRYVEAFRKKAPGYCDLLRPNAEVMELGPHLGAFLEVAEDWRWRPTGVDIGKDTADFCNSRGLLVRRQTLEDGHFQPRTFDGVFIWNCFEQLADPGTTLQGAYLLLKKDGLLIIRVPNALFYETFSQAIRHPGQNDFAAHALAYNNLLGFPYLYGYTPEALAHLITPYGFVYVRGFNSELVTMPFSDITHRISSEQTAISAEVGTWSGESTLSSRRLTGPWIEMVFRKLTENDWWRRQARGPVEQAQRLQRRIDLRFLERAA